MVEIWTGMLARSKQGHDKGRLFFIADDDGEYVFLADGKRRTLEKLKKKKRKHIQVIKIRPFEEEKNGTNVRIRNEDIKRILKKYETIEQ